MDKPVLRVADMTPEQLADEVWYWRMWAAGEIASAISDRDTLGDVAPDQGLMLAACHRASSLAEALENALQGEVLDKCGICAEPIAYGAGVVRDIDLGEVHANCMGEPYDGDGPIKPGDKVRCDPESILDENDEPETDGRDYLVAHSHDRLWTDDQIVSRLEGAWATLENSPGARGVELVTDLFGQPVREGHAEVRHYLDDYTDEVVPCDCTLPGWAKWLSAPDLEWSRPEAATPGASFAASRVTVEELACTFTEGCWTYNLPWADVLRRRGGEFVVRFDSGTGWDADHFGPTLDEALETIAPSDEGDVAYVAALCDRTPTTVRYEVGDDGPRCVEVET